MSLKDELKTVLSDLNTKDLKVDKDADYQGRPGTKISFVMTDPVGLNTGDLDYEVTFTNDLGLNANRLAVLTRVNAEKHARAFVFDREVE